MARKPRRFEKDILGRTLSIILTSADDRSGEPSGREMPGKKHAVFLEG